MGQTYFQRDFPNRGHFNYWLDDAEMVVTQRGITERVLADESGYTDSMITKQDAIIVAKTRPMKNI
ncbi:hypothetical protein [Echinicola vietnamensis]|uniref:hypothetical protein n=1 Tax=Echinicola vietnamensis TaxID=390884 RepID=UPI0005A22B2F|nr:hypothetical protein [Echinicola vietnamensis]